MNLQLKGLGASRGKVIALAVLGAVLSVVFYLNVLAPSDDTPAATAIRSQSVSPAGSPGVADDGLRAPAPETRSRPPLKPGQQSLRPEFKLGLKDKQPDPASINPTLKLDLLAKVQSVQMAGGVRNLFQFGAPPLPPHPEPQIKLASGPGAPAATGPTPPSTPPPTPPPPPIPLKFYGYASPAPSGAKRIFLLDGDEIIVVAEGQLVKSRYKVVRVGINSVVLEDLQFKHQQTLPLEDQPKEQTG